MNIERGNALKTLEKRTCFVYGAPVWCNTYHIVVNVVSVQVFVTYVTYSVLIEVLLIWIWYSRTVILKEISEVIKDQRNRYDLQE